MKEEEKEKPISTYNLKIVPKIKEIDIFLKETEKIQLSDVANILEITQDELDNILSILNITEITEKNFLQIMINGSSLICKILKREIECGSPFFYSPKDISYIYNLSQNEVEKAFEFLNLKKVITSQIPAILIQL